MASRDNLHSRVVAGLRIILPLAALGLLSTVFLLATMRDQRSEIPYSEFDLEEMASAQAVDSPVFSSVTDEGNRIVVTADQATPRGGNYEVVDAVEVHGTLHEEDGTTIDLRSERGTIYAAESRTVLSGDVRIATSSGYRLVTEELTSSTSRTDIQTAGPVRGTGPLGTIEAGRMAVTSHPMPDGTGEALTMVFKDGVKVIYEPKAK